MQTHCMATLVTRLYRQYRQLNTKYLILFDVWDPGFLSSLLISCHSFIQVNLIKFTFFYLNLFLTWLAYPVSNLVVSFHVTLLDSSIWQHAAWMSIDQAHESMTRKDASVSCCLSIPFFFLLISYLHKQFIVTLTKFTFRYITCHLFGIGILWAFWVTARKMICKCLSMSIYQMAVFALTYMVTFSSLALIVCFQSKIGACQSEILWLLLCRFWSGGKCKARIQAQALDSSWGS